MSTGLCHACQEANLPTVKSLLEQGKEDINVRGRDGMTPLHLLCSGETNLSIRIMILNLFLKQNVELNAQDSYERTALHYACSHNLVPMVERLIKAGSDTEIEDCDGDTPFISSCRLASESWYFWYNDCLNYNESLIQTDHFPPYLICRILLKSGADPKQATLLPSAVLYGDMSIVSDLISLGVDVNMLDENCRSPLGCACSSPYISSSMVKLLLENGADPNGAAGGRKNKPLIVAYVYNSVEKIQLLLSYGAIISNDEMSEIVSISLSKWFLENPEVIHEDSQELASWKLLLKAGFRPNLNSLMLKVKRVTLCNSYAQASPWIFSLLFPMSSLKDICRVSIRSSLTPAIDGKVESLPLPNSLKNFLRFS